MPGSNRSSIKDTNAVLGRKGAGELDDVLIEKRHPRLNPMSHRHLVLAYQEVDEVRAHVVLQAIGQMV